MLHIWRTSGESLLPVDPAEPSKGSWISLTQPEEAELDLAGRLTGCPADFLRAALDEEERPRIEAEEDALLVVTDLPVIRGPDRFDTLPLGIVVTPDHLVTVCLEVHPVLSEFGPAAARTFSTAKKTRFLFQILYRSATLYLRFVQQIVRRSDEIEDHLRRSMQNRELFQMLELQKGLTFFTTSLRANGILMEKLLRLRAGNQLKKLIPMFEEDEDLLEDAIIENRQALEMVATYSHIMNGMMGAFTSIISNNLNIVIKFLASMTILLAIPTMVSSFWGMNVAVPLQEQGSAGFYLIAGISAAVTAISAVILWRQKMF